MSTGRRLAVRREGAVMTVTFDNPPRHFFDEEMSVELDGLTRALRRDPSVRVVVFTGTGTSFLTHFDVPSLARGASSVPLPLGFGAGRLVAAVAGAAVRGRRVDRALRKTIARHALFLARTTAALDRLTRLDKVVVAEINGLCLGMGCILALACDIRVIADDVLIGLPESDLEILAGAGGTQRLTRTVGTGAALDLLLRGHWITAREAARLSLVQHVHPRERLHDRVLELCEGLARPSAVVTREIKRAVHETSTRPSRAALCRETAGTARTLSTRAAARELARYERYLAAHEPLTDEVILRGWTQGVDQEERCG
ncbi:enoyl-CoA hydratase/isomerase family protein [Actinomadura montaniterrae]|nr:enoyl-CoA hydratase/isomerase family protein [Actinomadura montaniterrae]